MTHTFPMINTNYVKNTNVLLHNPIGTRYGRRMVFESSLVGGTRPVLMHAMDANEGNQQRTRIGRVWFSMVERPKA